MIRRQTIQRDLVYNAVMHLHRHVTADDVYEYLQLKHPSIGKGTVYRNLNILAEEQLIRKVEVPNGPDCFDFRVDKHFHVKCLECGSMFDVDMPANKGLERQIQDPHGFVFLDYDILFKGICPECQRKRREINNGQESDV